MYLWLWWKPKAVQLLKLETGWMKEPEMQSVASLAGTDAKQSTCPPLLHTPICFGMVYHVCKKWLLRRGMWWRDNRDKVSLHCTWLMQGHEALPSASTRFSHMLHHARFSPDPSNGVSTDTSASSSGYIFHQTRGKKVMNPREYSGIP